MAIYKCKMCGGTLEFEQGATVGVCDHCGTKQTLPRLDDERRTNLYDRANHFRRNNDYDKAAGIYEKILNEDATDAEAYWSLVLCRYGIEYVEDPATHRRVPTVNRAQFTSVFDDGNYKSALQYADALQRALYEEEAAAINEIQKGILAISQKEEPFDVFICYKETDANGRRTQDSVLANDLYHQLTQEGFKVFFSRITLEDKLGTAYEPYIFAALNSAKVMVVLGTKPEHFNAVWVKNEWSRYLALVKQSGGKKVLIPAYRDMDPYDLPEEFSHLQAQDMSKLGFMQDLIRGIKKIAAVDTPKAVKEPVVISSGNASAAQPLIDRGYMALEDKEWAKADEFFEQALNLDAKNGDAYLGKFLVSVKHASFQSFLKERGDRTYIDRRYDKPQKAAFKLKEDALKQVVAQYVVPGYLEEETLLQEWSEFDSNFASEYDQVERHISGCHMRMDTNKDLLRAKQYGKPEISRQADALFETLNEMLAQAKQADEDTITEKKKAYQLFVRDFQIKAAQKCEDAKRDAAKDAAAEAERRATKERDLNEKYQKAVILANKANSVDTYNQAIKAFVQIKTYRDSDKQVQALTEQRDRIQAQKKKEREKKKKRTAILLTCIGLVAVVVLAVVLFVDSFIKPNNQYNIAVQLMSEGKFNEAVTSFEALNGFKDSDERIEECKKTIAYNDAMQLINNGQYEKAVSAFEKLDGFKDSRERIIECKKVIAERDYKGAIQLMNAGSPLTAYQCFARLDDYKDSKEQAKKCRNRYRFHETVSAGASHIAGLKKDGTVVAVGDNTNGQCDVSGWKNIIAISAGYDCTVGLRKNGTVVVAGKSKSANMYYEYDVNNWKDIVAISAGWRHIVGLKKDGTVVDTASGGLPFDVSGWNNIIAISAGFEHIVGLKKDGTVVAVGRYVGDTEYGVINVSGWKDIVAISAGTGHTVGLKKDGTVVADGLNDNGKCDVSDWKDIVAISAGTDHTFGLKKDGTVVVAGNYSLENQTVFNRKDIVAVSLKSGCAVGLKRDETVVYAGHYTVNNSMSDGSIRAVHLDINELCSDADKWNNIKLP